MIKALLLLLISVQVLAADLPGRLFYTPQQRSAKKQHVVKHGVSDLAYQGYVKRSDGVNTQWVNGQVRSVGMQQDVTAYKQLGLPDIKPGQRYSSQQHKVLESYEQVAISPAKDELPWQPPQLDDHDAPDSPQ
jgi:hypothetical protein